MPAISSTRARTAASSDTPENSRHCLPCCGHDGRGNGLGHRQLREDLHELEGAGHAALASATGPSPAMLRPLK